MYYNYKQLAKLLPIIVITQEKVIMKKFLSTINIIFQYLENASVQQLIQLFLFFVFGSFLSFGFIIIGLISILIKSFHSKTQTKINEPSKNHCKQVEHIQQVLENILDEYKQQKELMLTIMDYVRINSKTPDEFRKHLERQYNEPIINDPLDSDLNENEAQ